jgi:hypothetical protein
MGPANSSTTSCRQIQTGQRDRWNAVSRLPVNHVTTVFEETSTRIAPIPVNAMPIEPYGLTALVSVALGLHGFRKGSLDVSGAIAAALAGYLTLGQPIKASASLQALLKAVFSLR